MKLWDPLPRAFECVDFTFEAVLSASAFAQLKRHRMATLLEQPYDPALGRTIPDSIRRAGLTAILERQLDRAEAFHRRLAEAQPEAAAYALTNAHRRRVLFKLNARALGHFSRLRCDPEAQWDIRRLAHTMVELAQEAMPLAGAFYGGKDCVEDLKRFILSDA
jgi:thymidylate synthase ThyX